jgi:hypothetical protein
LSGRRENRIFADNRESYAKREGRFEDRRMVKNPSKIKNKTKRAEIYVSPLFTPAFDIPFLSSALSILLFSFVS